VHAVVEQLARRRAVLVEAARAGLREVGVGGAGGSAHRSASLTLGRRFAQALC
jgi:hypothetical protein